MLNVDGGAIDLIDMLFELEMQCGHVNAWNICLFNAVFTGRSAFKLNWKLFVWFLGMPLVTQRSKSGIANVNFRCLPK